MANPKKRAQTRGKKPVPRPRPAAANLSADEAALVDLAARLLTLEAPEAEAPTPETLAAGLDELRAVGPAAASVLGRLAQEGDTRALPLLGAALADDALVLGAVQALARVADPEAARLLDGVARGHADRTAAKAARKSLFELRRAGVIWEAPADQTPREEWPLYKAFVTHMDGAGTQDVWIARRGTFGTLRIVSFSLDETLGIKECNGTENYGRVDFDRIIEQGPRDVHPTIFAPIDLPYARWLVEQARTLNRESGFQLPMDFYTWKDMLGEPVPDEEGRPHPAELAPDVVRNHPEWLDKSGELFQSPACHQWLLGPDELEPYVERYMRSQMRESVIEEQGLADLGAKQDEGIVVRQVVRELFAEKRLSRMQRRLDETAIVLWLIGEQEQARWAAAAALALAEGIPAEEVPFLYELARASLELLLTTMKQVATEQGLLGPEEEGEEETETRPSGILLPGDMLRPPEPPPVEEPPRSPGGIYLPR